MFFLYKVTYSSTTTFIVLIILEYLTCTNMNVGKKEKSVNSFSKHVCGYKGCTSVLEKSGYTSVLEESYQNTTMQMNLNPYLNDHNIQHFILHIANMDPENRHPLLTIWLPQGGQGNIVIEDTHIKFVDFHPLPPSGDSLITLSFDFASDENYCLNDDYGSEYEGYIKHIFGNADGEIIH